MNKNIVIGIMVLAAAGAAFWGGTAYGSAHSRPGAARASLGGQFAMRGMGAFFGRSGMGGATAGQIISVDSSGMTVKMPDGSTKIVLLSDTTAIMHTVEGSLSDLQIGANVLVAGSANSDGSITAESVQIRPATTTRSQ